MDKQEKKLLLESAARELKMLIDDVNVRNCHKASAASLGEPDHHDYQTCYELQKLSEEI